MGVVQAKKRRERISFQRRPHAVIERAGFTMSQANAAGTRKGRGKMSLTWKILLGMALGAGTGLVINLAGNTGWVREWVTEGLFEVVGTIFIRALKLLVVPLVFVSLACGTAALGDINRLGRMGLRTLALYVGTTMVALTLAVTAGVLVKPGSQFELKGTSEFQVPPSPPVKQVIIDMFPQNPIDAMARGDMMQVLVFSLLVGIALVLSGEAGKRVTSFLEDVNEVVMRLVMILIELAPYGVFALIGRTFAREGFEAILPLAKYFFLVLAVLALHLYGTYPLLLRAMTGLNPVTLLKKMRKAQVFAFSTSSSAATLPVTMEVLEDDLGVDNSVTSFTAPLGATINMDGSAIMQGVATVFIAQVYGVDLTLLDLVTVVGMATLASIGAAAVPGSALITLSMVLTQVNLPVEGIALIIGVDRLLDMARTVVNITGDATVTCIIGKGEGRLDEDIYRREI